VPSQEIVLRHIKDQRHLPVIVLINEVAMEEWEPTVGVDDFVVKPVRLNELAARIRRVLARMEGTADDPHARSGSLTIDTDAYQVFVGGKAIDLTFKEYELLKFLASNPGTIFSREALLNRVWGYDYYGGERTVDVHIRRLRSKIEVGDQTFIETVRGVGYRFKEASDQGFRRNGSALSTESHRRL
jgi:DNA-binding response OmpR family regulator